MDEINKIKEQNADVLHDIQGGDISSFKSGGIIKNLIIPNTKDALINIIRILKDGGAKYYILGYGSNTLISMRGVENIISLKRLDEVSIDGQIVSVGAGKGLIALAKEMKDSSLSGLERLSGIPGSVGGAVVMNAGAYDSEIKDLIVDIDVLSGDCVERLENRECKFRYRGSALKDNNLIVLSARLRLKSADIEDIKREMQRVKNKRIASQPNEPSVGCTFLRASGLSAGAYIDALGLKGFKIGGVEVSKKHAGFIINNGTGTTDEYLSLAEIIEKKVYCAYGVQLKREFVYIGD